MITRYRRKIRMMPGNQQAVSHRNATLATEDDTNDNKRQRLWHCAIMPKQKARKSRAFLFLTSYSLLPAFT